MKNLVEKIQDNLELEQDLKEDVGMIPGAYDTFEVSPKVDNALETIADYIKTNNTNDKKEVKIMTLNILSALDNKFTGKWGHLGSMVFDAIKAY